jgi:hypothetical protein
VRVSLHIVSRQLLFALPTDLSALACQANVQSNVSTSQPATVAAVCSVLADAGWCVLHATCNSEFIHRILQGMLLTFFFFVGTSRSDAATRQLAQAAPDASMAAAPGTVLAAPGFTVMQTAVAATDASAPKMSSGSVPSAPTAAVDAFSAPAMPAAVVAPVELQSYEISPYKSGSDRCNHTHRKCHAARVGTF